MGALVTRYLQHLSTYKGPENFGSGYINKLISIAGPHLGSPFARELLSGDSECVRKIMRMAGYASIQAYGEGAGKCPRPNSPDCRSGAIADLAGDGVGKDLSPALRKLKTGGVVPVAYVIGNISEQAVASLNVAYDASKVYYNYGGSRVYRNDTRIDNIKAICLGSRLSNELSGGRYPVPWGAADGNRFCI